MAAAGRQTFRSRHRRHRRRRRRRHRRRRLQCRCDRGSFSRRRFAYSRAAASNCLLSKQPIPAAAYRRIIVDICGDHRLRSGAIFAHFSRHDFRLGVDLFLKRRLESAKRVNIVVEAAKSADSASAAAHQINADVAVFRQNIAAFACSRCRRSIAAALCLKIIVDQFGIFEKIAYENLGVLNVACLHFMIIRV